MNLSKSKAFAKPYDAIFAKNFLGGRGFAAKILWNEFKSGIDPLSPENKLVFAVGPLTGFALPSGGKMVVASKSEYSKKWSVEMDVPPARWFQEPLTKGSFKGAKLDRTKYNIMLRRYYKKRGWDERGVPTKTTLKKLGLEDVAKQLQKHVKLVD